MQDEYADIRVGERLRAAIEGQGETLASFSRRCGVPYRSLQDYVGDKSRPGFLQLVKFAEAGLDITFILTGKYRSLSKDLLPDSISLGEGVSVGLEVPRRTDIEEISRSIDTGMTLREWIDIWNLADDCVPTAKEFKIEHRRRQGAVAFAAAGIVLDLVKRLQVLGWLKG